MNSGLEAAWIAGGSGLLGAVVGVSGAVIVARVGFRSSKAAIDRASADLRAQIEATSADTCAQIEAAAAVTRAQIEAERRGWIWQQQSVVYTDTVAYLRYRQEARRLAWLRKNTATDPAARARGSRRLTWSGVDVVARSALKSWMSSSPSSIPATGTPYSDAGSEAAAVSAARPGLSVEAVPKGPPRWAIKLSGSPLGDDFRTPGPGNTQQGGSA